MTRRTYCDTETSANSKKDPSTDPRLSKRPQGLVGTRWVRFWWPGPPGVADGPKTSQRLLKRLLSHFAYDESPAVRTRICCVVGGRLDSPKDLSPKGVLVS
jgi:hypothetical protein